MKIKAMRYIFMVSIALAAALLAGCAVYKAEIQQGNVVTQEMIDKLKPGMTRGQVRYVLGTPLISDPFHQERWDYYYFLKKANETAADTQRLSIIFKNDVLATVQSNSRNKAEETGTNKSGTPSSGVEPASRAPDAPIKLDSAL